jgi:uncharacterized repeat protein (TIGR01451 family)
VLRAVSRADLHAGKTADPQVVIDEDIVVYSLTVSNRGPEDAVEVLLVDALPPALAYDALLSDPLCVSTNGQVHCPVGNLQAGQSTSVTLAARVEFGTVGAIVNAVEAHTVSIDTNGVDNSGSVLILVQDLDGDGQPDFQDTDDDGDRMPDAWEIEVLLDPKSAADAGQDSDGDAQVNIEEFIADTDPRTNTSYFSVEGVGATPSPTVMFESAEDRVYTLQYRDADLSPWSNVAGRVRLPGHPSGQSQLDDPGGRSGRSYRLQVEYPGAP